MLVLVAVIGRGGCRAIDSNSRKTNVPNTPKGSQRGQLPAAYDSNRVQGQLQTVLNRHMDTMRLNSAVGINSALLTNPITWDESRAFMFSTIALD
jgi:hypothetical protein